MQEACEARLLDRPLDFTRHGVYSGAVAPSEKSGGDGKLKRHGFLMRFHELLLGNQQALWSKQHNGKVRPDVHDMLTTDTD
jgi:hypothetical protein